MKKNYDYEEGEYNFKLLMALQQHGKTLTTKEVKEKIDRLKAERGAQNNAAN